MYSSLNKEEKKVIRDKFMKTNKAKEILPIFNRLIIEGIACLICGTLLVIFSLMTDTKWYYLVIGTTCLIAGFIFLIAQHYYRIKQYNMMMNKTKK